MNCTQTAGQLNTQGCADVYLLATKVMDVRQPLGERPLAVPRAVPAAASGRGRNRSHAAGTRTDGGQSSWRTAPSAPPPGTAIVERGNRRTKDPLPAGGWCRGGLTLTVM